MTGRDPYWTHAGPEECQFAEAVLDRIRGLCAEGDVIDGMVQVAWIRAALKNEDPS